MKKLLVIFLLMMCAFAAKASQNPTQLPTVSPYAGLTMLNNINSAFNTFQSNFSGATAPAGTGSPTTYQLWSDTTDSTLRFYDGSVWQPMGKWSGAQWVPTSNSVPAVFPTSTGSSNAYVVTYSPVPSALVTGQHYPFIANFQNTGASTLNVNSLGAKAIKKYGGTVLASADIVNGAAVDTIYDGTNLQMISQLGNSASGTVTSIATNNGITGGTITASGTIGLASIANNNLLGNFTGSSGVPVAIDPNSMLDSFYGSTQGSIIYRESGGWGPLLPGTNGQPLLSGGSGANISFGQLPVGSISASGTPSSTTFLRGDGAWSSTTSLPSALGVGSIIMATTNSNISVGASISASSLTVQKFASSLGSLILNPTGDSITGTWRALQTLVGGESGLFLRIS